jgi:hypothetical protein
MQVNSTPPSQLDQLTQLDLLTWQPHEDKLFTVNHELVDESSNL